MPRTSIVTTEAIAAAAAIIEREGSNLTVRAVQERIGGATNVVMDGLRAYRTMRDSSRTALRNTGILESVDALCVAVGLHEAHLKDAAEKKLRKDCCRSDQH